MSSDDKHIDLSIQLEPIASAPKSSQLTLAILVGAGILLGTTVLVLFVWKLSSKFERGDGNLRVARHRSVDALCAESASQFRQFAQSGDLMNDVDADEHRKLDEIQAMFDQLAACYAAGDEEGTRDCVDFDRLVLRIDGTGNLAGWTSFDKRALRTQLKKNVDATSFWGRMRVIGVATPPGNHRSRVVYAICVDDDGEQTEARFWIAKRGDSWKVYDWERLDLGLSTSREYGIYCKYVNSPLMQGYERWTNLVVDADELTDNGEYDAAKAKLRVAETEPVPPELKGYKWLLTSYRWSALGETDDVLRCSRNVANPRANPGAFYNLMAHQSWTNPTDALSNAVAYEEAVGPSPDLLETKIELLEQLERADEAQTARRMLLRMNPDNSIALVDYLESLPADGKSKIIEVIEEYDDPVDVVAGIITAAVYRDYAGSKHLVEFLARTAPDNPVTTYANGILLQLDGEYEQAAELFHSAYLAEQNEDQRNSYVDAYIEVMTELGRVVEAVQAAPNKQEAIESLLYGYDDDEAQLTDAELRSIVDIYATEFPDELEAVDRQVALAFDDQRYADAQRLLERALAKIPAETDGDDQDEFDEVGYYRGSFQQYLARSLYEQGMLKQAYDAPGDRTDRIRRLTNLATTDKRWADVRQLVTWHEQESPHSPDVFFARAELAEHDGEYELARTLFSRGLAKLPEDQRWMRVHQFRRMCLDSDGWRDYYTGSGDSEEAFSTLADQFIENHQWSELNELIAEHRNYAPDDYRIVAASANAAWEQQEYRDYIRHASRLLQVVEDGELRPYEEKQLQQRLLTSQLHRKRLSLARSLAEERLAEDNDTAGIAIVHAASGNHRDAEQFAKRAAAKHDDASQFYQHELVGSEFLRDAYRGLQQEYPVDIPYNVAPRLVVFFLDGDIALSVDDVKLAMDRLGVAAPIDPLQKLNSKVERALVVRFNTASVWVAYGHAKLNDGWSLDDDGSPLGAVLDGHQGWLAVGVAAWHDKEQEQAAKLARAVSLQLAGDRARAAIPQEIGWSYDIALLPIQPEWMRAWQESGDLRLARNIGVDVDHSSEPLHVIEQREFARNLRRDVVEFESSSDHRLTVWAALVSEPRVAPISMSVTRVKRSYGSLRFEGALQESSLLLPELTAGLPMQFSEYEVVAWQLDSQPRRHRP